MPRFGQALANKPDKAISMATGLVTLQQAELIDDYQDVITQKTDYPDQLAQLIVALHNTSIPEPGFIVMKTINAIAQQSDFFDILMDTLKILTENNLFKRESWLYIVNDQFEKTGSKTRYPAVKCLADANILTRKNWTWVCSEDTPAGEVATALVTLENAKILIDKYRTLLFPTEKLHCSIDLLSEQIVKLHKADILDKIIEELKKQLLTFNQYTYQKECADTHLVRLVDGWIALKSAGLFSNDVGIRFKKDVEKLGPCVIVLQQNQLLTQDNYDSLVESLNYKNTDRLGTCLKILDPVKAVTQENFEELLYAGKSLKDVTDALKFLRDEKLVTQKNTGLLIVYPEYANMLHGLWFKVSEQSPNELTASDIENLLACGKHFEELKTRYPSDSSIPENFGIVEYRNLIDDFQLQARVSHSRVGFG